MSLRTGILIISNSVNPAVEPVFSILQDWKESVCRLNIDDYPSYQIITLNLAKNTFQTKLALPGGSVDLTAIKSVWFRAARALPAGRIHPFTTNEASAALWSLYTSLDGAFWMNPPMSGKLIENNKFYQARLAKEAGLVVPDTIVTHDPDVVIEFCRAHGDVIAMKLLSGQLFQNEPDQEYRGIYTQQVTTDMLLKGREEIALCPVMAQAYIPKEFELRITVVGESVFSCAIDSQASERTKVDWRKYDFKNVRHKPYDLPQAISTGVLNFMRSANLQFAAIDMIVTPNGDYVFLEANPQGQWGWIESLAGLPISNAIARLLANPP